MPARTRACPFCRIAAGEEAARLVLEQPGVLAFLDHRPLLPGHCLVIPRAHVETLSDLPPDQVGPLFLAVQRLSAAVERALGADGSFVAVNIRISQSVPHLHVHVVPRRRGDGLFGADFRWRRRPYPSEAEAASVQAAIRAALGEAGVTAPDARPASPEAAQSPPGGR